MGPMSMWPKIALNEEFHNIYYSLDKRDPEFIMDTTGGSSLPTLFLTKFLGPPMTTHKIPKRMNLTISMTA